MVTTDLVGKISVAPHKPMGIVFKGTATVNGRQGNLTVVEWRQEDMEPFLSFTSDCCRSNVFDNVCSDCRHKTFWGGESVDGPMVGFLSQIHELQPLVGVDTKGFEAELWRVHAWAMSVPMVPEWEEGVVPWATAATGEDGSLWTPIL